MFFAPAAVFIYPHSPLYSAQAPNAGTGDTNWRLVFDPCMLQLIESHVI